MALPKKKKPGVAIGIMVGTPKSKPGEDLPSMKGPDEPDADDQPGAPPSAGDNDRDDTGAMGECKPDPEAVCFRSEQETCQYCNYMQGNRCSHPIVAMPVGPGDSCNAFEAKGQDQGQPPTPGMNQGEAPPSGGEVQEQS